MKKRAALMFVGIILIAVSQGFAQDRFDLGVRAAATVANGKPANDILSAALFGHYRWSDRWALGFAIDSAAYDVERPAEIIGLRQDPSVDVIDADAESTTVSAWVERLYSPGGRTESFLGAGLGVASVDVLDASGPLAGGGTFDISTDAGTEVVVSIVGGWRLRMGSRLMLELGLRADDHFADWKLEDRVSGTKGTVDDYFTYGAQVGVLFRF